MKPIFSYIGGKSWLKNKLRERVEKNLSEKKITNYIEPFIGGLGAFLAIHDILLKHNIKNIQLNDINSNIVNFYNIIKNQPLDLIKEFTTLENNFKSLFTNEMLVLHKTKDKEKLKKELIVLESFYKDIRKKYNSESDFLLKSSYLLFLQMHCFNGIYRENSSGGHNVPFNWEAKSVNIEETSKRIIDMHNLFKNFNIIFSNTSFEDLIFKEDSLVYCDPPYANDNILENKYSKIGFSNTEQIKLIDKLYESNCSFLYSNHNLKWIIEYFESKMPIFNEIINRKNIISSCNESRKEDKSECLISRIF